MPSLRASVSGSYPAVDPYNLSFDEICRNGIPGRYKHRNGKVLVSLSKSANVVNCGRATRTGYTRIGMFIVQNGKARLLVSNNGYSSRDTARNWMKLPDSASISL